MIKQRITKVLLWMLHAIKKYLLWFLLVFIGITAGLYAQYLLSPIMQDIAVLYPDPASKFPCTWGDYSGGECGIWTRLLLNLPSIWSVFLYDMVIGCVKGALLALSLWFLIRKKEHNQKCLAYDTCHCSWLFPLKSINLFLDRSYL